MHSTLFCVTFPFGACVVFVVAIALSGLLCTLCIAIRDPTVKEKRGGEILSWKVMENWQNNNVIEIENILKKSWNFSTVYHESRTRSSVNSISTGMLQLFGYGRFSVYVLVSKS